MAVVYQKRSANAKKRRLLRLGMALCALAPAALSVWYAALWAVRRTPPAPALGVCALAAAAAGALAAPKLYARAAVLTSGLDGERRAATALRALPNACRVLMNPVYHVHGQTMELDAVVIAKSGVFVVEAKNHAGVITGKPDAEWWSQKKSRGAKSMKNPLTQLERQLRLTRQLLDDAGVHCPLCGYVFFADPGTRVSVRDARIYTDAAALRRAIQNAPVPRPPVDVRAVTKLLEQACE